eukprot:7735410-Alexandrium_andersonii.AAC.1
MAPWALHGPSLSPAFRPPTAAAPRTAQCTAARARALLSACRGEHRWWTSAECRSIKNKNIEAPDRDRIGMI